MGYIIFIIAEVTEESGDDHISNPALGLNNTSLLNWEL
jgi:hypothetical protein